MNLTRNFPDWIDAYMEFNANSEAPTNYLQWTAISTVAAALGRKCWCSRGMLRTYPNMYIILVGDGAVGKGISMQYASDIIRKTTIKLCPDTVTKSSLIKLFVDSMDTIGDGDDAITHSSLTLMSPEIKTFLTNSGMDLIHELANWFDNGMSSGGGLRDLTITHGERIAENIFFNMLGGITPDTLRMLVTKGIMESGLSSRIVFVHATKPSKYEPFPQMPDEYEQFVENLADDLEIISFLKGDFVHSQDYIEAYTEWFFANCEPDSFRFKEPQFSYYFHRKIRLHVPKIAMILSASESNSKIITSKHLEKAIEIIEAAEDSLPIIFGGMGALGLKGIILHEIRMMVAECGIIKYSGLYEKYQYQINEDELWTIVAGLDGTGALTLKPAIPKDQTILAELFVKTKTKTSKEFAQYLREDNYRNRLLAYDWLLCRNS